MIIELLTRPRPRPRFRGSGRHGPFTAPGRARRLAPRSVDTTIAPPVWASRDPFHGRATVAANAGQPGQHSQGNAGERLVGGDTVSRMPELRGTIVLATYNSGASVGPGARRDRRSGVGAAVARVSRSTCLLVDDSSPDNTAAIATDEAATAGHQARSAHRLAPRPRPVTAGRIRTSASHRRSRLLRHPRPRRSSRRPPDHRRRPNVRRPAKRCHDRIAVGSWWILPRHVRGALHGQPHRQLAGPTDHRSARRTRRDHIVPHHPSRCRPGCGSTGRSRPMATGTSRHRSRSPRLRGSPSPSARSRSALDMRACGRISFSDITAFWRSLHTTRVLVAEVRDEGRRDQATWAARSPRMQAQHASSNSQFGAAEELENLAQANHFFGWIADELTPHLGQRILEVGAGHRHDRHQVGERKPASEITAIEPAENLFEQLETTTTRLRNVTAAATDLAGARIDETAAVRFDRVRQRARAHPRRCCRDADRVRSRRTRRLARRVRTGDVTAVRQPRLQVGSPSPVRQGTAP